MTTDLLVKCTGQAKRKRDESQEQFLRRITHLYCSERGIEAIVSTSHASIIIFLCIIWRYPINFHCITMLYNNILYFYRRDFQVVGISQFSISTTTSSLA